MNPQLLAIETDKNQRAPRAHFIFRSFRQMLALTWPFRRLILVGLLATVVFAALHTLSVGAVFPVFKVLLEEEGVHTWVHRMVAGERLDVEFAAPSEADARSVRLAKVSSSSTLYAKGVRAFDLISSPDGLPVKGLLREVAEAGSDSEFTILVEPAQENVSGYRGSLTVRPKPPGFEHAAMLRALGLLPSDASADRIQVLKYILVGLIVLLIIANTCRYAGEVLISKALLRAMMSLRATLYERILHMPMGFFSGQETADLVTRFVQDVQEIQRGLTTLFGKFVREPMRAVFLLGFAFFVDWRITLLLVVITPITVVIFVTVGRKVKKANRRLLEGYGRMVGALTTSLQNIRVVKAYTAEEPERVRLRKVDCGMFKQQLRLAKLQAFTSPMLETLGVFGASIVTVWLAGRVVGGDLSPTKFLGLGVVITAMFDPLRKLTDVYVRVMRSTAGAERIFGMLQIPIETEDSIGTIELKPLEHGVEYENVTFTYPGADQPALDGVTLSIRKGESVAIVGPNGCGKTTLVSMLPRLFKPEGGTIRYDGVDVQDAKITSLRKQISLVSQDAVVFAGTPVENIAYGNDSPDQERVRDAARRAHAEEFILDLPRGYDEVLGERGTTLSGGQRQRLAIARAIYRNAPILIFDEATSQVDSESERNIQEALADYSKDRTTFIVAHRLSTIQFADRIFVMDRGRILDTGTHEELLKRSTFYRNLCETQLVSDNNQ
ncbi:MAG: ABC transporter ATP-binding protein [Phycisphaerales bacterium]|nr:MAG: ABC transporter ATP-binding protein [Phycisphaerales bacterium]